MGISVKGKGGGEGTENSVCACTAPHLPVCRQNTRANAGGSEDRVLMRGCCHQSRPAWALNGDLPRTWRPSPLNDRSVWETRYQGSNQILINRSPLGGAVFKNTLLVSFHDKNHTCLLWRIWKTQKNIKQKMQPVRQPPLTQWPPPFPPSTVVSVTAGRCLSPAWSLTSQALLVGAACGKPDFKSHPHRDPPHLRKLEVLSSHLSEQTRLGAECHL